MKITINVEELEKIVAKFYNDNTTDISKTNVHFNFLGYKNLEPKAKIVMERNIKCSGINIRTEEVLSKQQLDKSIKFAFSADYNISNIKFVTDFDNNNQEYISGIKCEAKRKSLSD